MNVLGVRCSNEFYAYAVLAGTKTQPTIIKVETVKYPYGYSEHQSLKWQLQEFESIIGAREPRKIILKAFEGMRHDSTFVNRIEHEAIAFLAAANCGVSAVYRRTNATIAKNLGLKGRGKYLKTMLNTSSIPDYGAYTEAEKDAIRAGWSELADG